MKMVSEIEASYTIIDLQIEWINHRLLINERSLVKFVKSPRIYSFPLDCNFIVGTYYHNGSLLPVISLVDYFDPNNKNNLEIENVLIVKTSGSFLMAFSNVIQSGFTTQSDLDQNIEFNNSYSTVFKSDQLIVEEFKIKGRDLRGFLIDLDYLQREIVLKIKDANYSTLKIVKNESSMIETVASDLSQLDSFISQTFRENNVKSSENDIESLQLIFRVDNQLYAISTNSILSILSMIPIISSTDQHFNYLKGVIKTMYGSANVFDLRTYFGTTPRNDGEYILLREDHRNFVFIVDEIVSYFEIPDYEIKNQVYPITGTENSFYNGLYILSNHKESTPVYLLSATTLSNHLFSGVDKPLGFQSQYQFNQVDENIDQFNPDNHVLIAWIGGGVRIGFELDVIVSIDNYEIKKSDKNRLFTSFNHPTFGDLPVFDLNEFYKIPPGESDNLVVLQKEDEFFSVFISGDIIIQPIPKAGNLDNLGFESIVFNSEQHLIQDFAIFENFIGYLLSVDEVCAFMILNKELPVKYQHEDTIVENQEYFVIESFNNIYCFPIDDIEGLIRTNTIDTDIYDLDQFIDGKLEIFSYPSPLFCIRLRNHTQYFSTIGAMDVVKITLETIQDELEANPEKPMVSLDDGIRARIISFKEEF